MLWLSFVDDYIILCFFSLRFEFRQSNLREVEFLVYNIFKHPILLGTLDVQYKDVILDAST